MKDENYSPSLLFEMYSDSSQTMRWKGVIWKTDNDFNVNNAESNFVF